MMTPVIPSTFVLTLLMVIGLFFFVRASTKDRIEQEKLISEQGAESLLTQIQQYFASRAYRITELNRENNQITFEGLVRPSWFLAIFLTLLTAVGLLCLGLVLSMVVPSAGQLFWGLVLLSPLAGWFYWKGSARPEQVCLKLDAVTDQDNQTQSLITVTAHRDELATLKQALNLKAWE
ncbi:MAG TPA: cofactor assembly of complex C subunit B [Oscillatoriales bacterium UBA8482]|nr:MAG: hypothetical protein AUK43_07675 [Oscillatoriales cyanobacterium CG2_30_40_61]HBW56485.1 cofactor assembly of complex C subunit B [Oscillatoriales bacterium UBA8482]